ncbi:MAG: hypothetical protein ED557_14745 [Balneola sp.]|nr:MAG: hypothetical protein ED557_14745 [Balneola sp.]
MSEFRRQHPVAAITQFLAVLRQNLVPIVIFVVVGSRNTDQYFFYFFALAIISTLILGIVGWFRFSFRVDGNELQIRKGVFVRKELFLTNDRIQVIDITEGLLQRLFGLVKVEVKSAGSGTESATISAITREEAEELRRLLRSNGVVQLEDQDAQEVRIEVENLSWKLSNRDLFLAALTSGNFGLIASILGATSGQLDQFINEENLEYVFGLIPGLGNISFFLGIAILILVVSYIFSFLGVILQYYGFEVEKKETELVITSGLLERKQTTVPFNRIQALRFMEGIFREPFGYGMLFVESAGFEQKGSEKSIVLLPFFKKENLETFLAEFIEPVQDHKKNISPPERAFFRYLRRPSYLIALSTPVIWFFWDFGWIFFWFLVPAVFLGWLRYKDAKLFYNDEELKLQYRVLAKRTAYIKKKRVQVSEYSINPLQRRKKLSTLVVTVASGAGGRAFNISDLDQQESERFILDKA